MKKPKVKEYIQKDLDTINNSIKQQVNYILSKIPFKCSIKMSWNTDNGHRYESEYRELSIDDISSFLYYYNVPLWFRLTFIPKNRPHNQYCILNVPLIKCYSTDIKLLDSSQRMLDEWIQNFINLFEKNYLIKPEMKNIKVGWMKENETDI